MARNRPVMFKGAAREWPAASKWNLDFFSEGAMGDTTINVSLDGKVSCVRVGICTHLSS